MVAKAALIALIVSLGSYGDFQSCMPVAVAVDQQRAGHRATLAELARFVAWARRGGLTLVYALLASYVALRTFPTLLDIQPGA
jgi:hypothetical protein